MRKIYRNRIRERPKPKTKAQLRREWEHTVIAGGMVRASAFPRTAMMLNKGRGAVVRVIGVPLYDNRQINFLEQLSDYGLHGQTAEEVAATFIMDGIHKAMKDGLLQKLAESRCELRRALRK